MNNSIANLIKELNNLYKNINEVEYKLFNPNINSVDLVKTIENEKGHISLICKNFVDNNPNISIVDLITFVILELSAQAINLYKRSLENIKLLTEE